MKKRKRKFFCIECMQKELRISDKNEIQTYCNKFDKITKLITKC